MIANPGSNGGDGGKIIFATNPDGGTAKVKVFGNGALDISEFNASGVTIGSLEGNGLLFLGSYNLSVGTNNRSTIFAGRIQDGGTLAGSGGSLTKVGSGTLFFVKLVSTPAGRQSPTEHSWSEQKGLQYR